MNRIKYLKNRLIISIHSFLLVASIAFTLGLLGWLIGGFLFFNIAIAGVVILYFVNPMLSPALVMKMFKGRKIEYYEALWLYEILHDLSRRADLKVLPSLYYIPGSMIKALTTGSGKNAVIGISEGLVNELNVKEIYAVMAHEISHIRNNDTRVLGFATFAGHITNLFSLLGILFLVLNLPLILIKGYTINWLFILILVFSPNLSFLFQLALSRAREYAADLGAVELMGEPDSLITALAKIENYQNRLLIRNFWIPYPRYPEESFMSTHPSTKKRIKRLLEISNRHKPLYGKPAISQGPDPRLRPGIVPGIQLDRTARY